MMAIIFIILALFLIGKEQWDKGSRENEIEREARELYIKNRELGIYESGLMFSEVYGCECDIFTHEKWQSKFEILPGHKSITYYVNKKGEKRILPNERLDFEMDYDEKKNYSPTHTVFEVFNSDYRFKRGDLVDLKTRRKVNEVEVDMDCSYIRKTEVETLIHYHYPLPDDYFINIDLAGCDSNTYKSYGFGWIPGSITIYLDYETNEVLRLSDFTTKFWQEHGVDEAGLQWLLGRIKYYFIKEYITIVPDCLGNVHCISHKQEVNI